MTLTRRLPLVLGLLLAACEALPPSETPVDAVVDASTPLVVSPPPPVDMSSPPVLMGVETGTDPATGLDRAAIVNLVPATDGLGVYYRTALVGEEALREVPAHVCDQRDAEVVAAHTREPQHPAELPGIRILTVQCTPPPSMIPLAVPSVPAATVASSSASPSRETADQKGSNP